MVQLRWEQIRAHYARHVEAAKARGATQTSIAKAGGLVQTPADPLADPKVRQNTISRTLSGDKRGPTVQTFVKAVHGLGIPMSEFFRQLEEEIEEAEGGPPKKPGEAPVPLRLISAANSTNALSAEDTELLKIAKAGMKVWRAIMVWERRFRSR